MKRLHVHVAVKDLAASVRFYSELFAAKPSVLKDDYAKWMRTRPLQYQHGASVVTMRRSR